MTPGRKLLLTILVLLIPVAYWRFSEAFYEKSVAPDGIKDVAGYFRKFGDPRLVKLTKKRDGDIAYYFFSGNLPPAYSLATVTSPPVYAFNKKGEFLDWCFDPGDDTEWMEQWDFNETEMEPVTTIKEAFGITGKK